MEREGFSRASSMKVGHIRQATSDEAPALLALINRAFAVEKFFVDHERITAEQLDGYLASGAFFLLEGDDTAPAASLYFEQRGDRAYVGMLAVDPDRQGQGIGRQMMAFAEQHARALGCGGVDIRVVNLREELPPFYRSLGYVETGRSEPVDDPGASTPYHFILMEKRFRSVRLHPDRDPT
jgi:GNAT superfamily N-acetyltransferase